MKIFHLLGLALVVQSSLSILYFFSIPSAYSISHKDAHFPAARNKQSDIWGPRHGGEQSDTGARDDCWTDVPISLTVLGPDTNYGKTFSAWPTLWFYVPYTSNQITYGEFILQNEDEYNVIEPVRFQLPNNDEAGFVSLSLSESISDLDVDQKYNWSFELFCSDISLTSVFVSGWIHVLAETSISQQLDIVANAPYEIYRDNFIWFDAVNTLMNHQDIQIVESEVQIAWNELMQDGNVLVEDITSTNIFGSVTVLDK